MTADKLRYFAAAMAAVAAIIYFLIGAGVLQVVDEGGDGMLTFGLVAGLGFALGVILLLAWKRRFIWILGALLQLFVIAMYFAVGPDRTPHYEMWGLMLRVPQVLILGSLAYLSLRRAPARLRPAAAR